MKNHVYVEVSKYINQVKQIEGIDSIIKDLLRPSPKDAFKRFKNNISIVDDWLIIAEEKMKYVEAAVYENRQFIREDGEVLPIERVKKISSQSTRHLAKHSDYIEKITEDNDVVPSKLYTISKDTDYGVYENKFLYLLLVTISDFVTREKEDIIAALKNLNGELDLVRENEFNNDSIKLEIKLNYKSANPESALLETEFKKLERMDVISSRAHSLLSTPLMQVVSKEPVISSIITKTNVLTMNENFSNSLELYEYLVNYDKQGFKIERQVQDIPIEKNVAYIMLALELMAQAYKDSSVDEYEKDKNELECQIKKLEIQAIEERINHIKSEYNDPSQYIQILMDKIVLLEEENKEIELLRNDIRNLDKIKVELDTNNTNLKSLIKELEDKCARLEYLVKNNDAKTQELVDKYEGIIIEKNDEIARINKELVQAVNRSQKMEYEKMEAISIQKDYYNRINELITKNNQLIEEYEGKLTQANESLRQALNDYQLLEAAVKAKGVVNMEILAADAEITEEAFDELEKEYNAFTAYYDAVWKRVKKEIIKEIKRKKG